MLSLNIKKINVLVENAVASFFLLSKLKSLTDQINRHSPYQYNINLIELYIYKSLNALVDDDDDDDDAVASDEIDKISTESPLGFVLSEVFDVPEL